MKNTSNQTAEIFFGLLIGALAILAIKSLFEDDNSKIISKKGRKILSDDKKMQEINKKIIKGENEQEIYI